MTPGRERALDAALLLLLWAPALLRAGEPAFFNHDVGWLLYCAGRWLAGATPYVDFIENNPPLVVWLSALPAAAARWTPLTPQLAYALFSLAVLTGACALARRALPRSWSGAERRLALLAFALPFFLAPGYDFGQRDHLAVAALLPLLATAAGRCAGAGAGTGFAAGVGLLGALGVALKPHLLLVWLALEAVVVVSTRDARSWRRPENLAGAAALALYALCVPALAPGFLDVMRWSLAAYPAYADPPALLARELRVAYAGLLASALPGGGPPLRALRRTTAAALLASIAVVFLQNRGFPYHFVPPALFGWAALALAAGALSPHLGALVPWVRRPLLVAVVGALSLTALRAAEDAAHARRAPGARLLVELERMVERHAPEGPILSLSTRVYPGFPLVNLSGASWTSRFANLWLVPAAYGSAARESVPFPYHGRDEMPELERVQLDSLAEDFAARPPRLLIVDTARAKQAFGETAFDFLAWAARHPELRRQLAAYRPLATLERYALFERAVP